VLVQRRGGFYHWACVDGGWWSNGHLGCWCSGWGLLIAHWQVSVSRMKVLLSWRLTSCLIAWFRPAGRVPFGSRPKRNQKVLLLHPALRFAQGSFAPSLLQGPAYKGHPWPFKPLAASMRLTPLRNDSAHPPERGIWYR